MARHPRIGVAAVLPGHLQGGVAEHEIGVPVELAGGFEFDALGFDVHARVVVAARAGVEAGIGAQVLLLGVEPGQRGQQALVEPVGLDAHLVVRALGRVQVDVVDVVLVLRLVDVRVADVAEHMVGEVVGEAAVGADVALGLVEEHAGVHPVTVELGVVEADHGLEPVGQRQPGHAEGALEPLVQRAVDGAGAPLRLGDRVAGIRERRQRAEGRIGGGHRVVPEGVFALGDAHAQHYLLVAAEQLEIAVDRGLAQIGGGDVAALVGPAVQAEAGGRVDAGEGIGEEQLVVVPDLVVVVGKLELPVVRELVAVFGERVLGGGVPVRPVLRGRGAARPLGLAAVVVIEGQRAPHVAVGPGPLVRVAEGQRAVLADLAVDHAVEEVALVVEAAQVRIAVLVHGDHAPGPGAVLGERRRIVRLDAPGAPRTVADADFALLRVGRALAHVVDGAGGVAHAGQQAVGAADHFDLVVAVGVRRAGGDAPVVGQADAVDLGVLDLEAAREVVGAVGLPLLDLDAGGQAQRIVDTVGAELLHLLAAHHADRLRRVLDVQVEVGGAVADALGALGDDPHRAQLGGRLLVGGLVRGRGLAGGLGMDLRGEQQRGGEHGNTRGAQGMRAAESIGHEGFPVVTDGASSRRRPVWRIVNANHSHKQWRQGWRGDSYRPVAPCPTWTALRPSGAWRQAAAAVHAQVPRPAAPGGNAGPARPAVPRPRTAWAPPVFVSRPWHGRAPPRRFACAPGMRQTAHPPTAPGLSWMPT